MKQYKVLKEITVVIITSEEHQDVVINPNEAVLEGDDATIWIIRNSKREETTNWGWMISKWLSDGSIELIPELQTALPTSTV